MDNLNIKDRNTNTVDDQDFNLVNYQEANRIIDALNTLETTVSDLEISTTPSYKIYRALLTQTGTSAPTAVVLENTLGGTLAWTRVANGSYRGTLSGIFLENKVFSTGSVLNTNIDSSRLIISIDRETDNTILLTGYDVTNVSNNLDGLLNALSIEVIVYN